MFLGINRFLYFIGELGGVTMIIDKILNNNVAVIRDENNLEEIVMGRGIAFNKRIGDQIDEKAVDKTFKLSTQEMNTKFKELLVNIPMEHVALADQIITYAKTKIGKRINESIYISLSDHLSTAIERCKNEVFIKNSMYWETKRFYPDEFKIGQEAIRMIEKETSILLPKDEAAFIALHFINAQLENPDQAVTKVTKVISEIETIIKHTFRIELDEDSVYYYRFITHLKFFASRLFAEKIYNDNQSDDLLEVIKIKYQNAFNCVNKIDQFIMTKYGYTLSDEEILYLTIHIARIVSESQKETH